MGWVYTKPTGMKNDLYEQTIRTTSFPTTQVAVLLTIHAHGTSIRCCRRLDSPDSVIWRVALAFVEPPVERELVGVLALPVGHISVGAPVDPGPRDLLPARLKVRTGGGFLILGHLVAGQGDVVLDRGSLVSPCGLGDNHMV